MTYNVFGHFGGTLNLTQSVNQPPRAATGNGHYGVQDSRSPISVLFLNGKIVLWDFSGSELPPILRRF